MIIEIRGTGCRNKGAELMLQVISAQLRAANPEVKIAVKSNFGTLQQRWKYGLLSILPEKQLLGRSLFSRALMTRVYRDSLGVAEKRDIDAVIDASGFAYGDFWGEKPLETLKLESEYWRKNSIPVVFMPQSFGPFTSGNMKGLAKSALSYSAKLYPREEKSAFHLNETGLVGNQIEVARDFTNLARGLFPVNSNIPETYACIAPNAHMVTRFGVEVERQYVQFLATAVEELRDCDFPTLIVCHDESDLKVVELIKEVTSSPFTIFKDSNPLILKGVIGKSQLLIGSRYHALVAALSQSVPVIATSWSHKYEALMKNYGISEFLLNITDHDELKNKIIDLSSGMPRESTIKLISEKENVYKRGSEELFQSVFSAIGLSN